MVPFIFLSITVILLTVWGAGIFAGALYVAAGFLSLGTLITSFLKGYGVRYNLPSSFLCFIITVWLIVTALPLPEILDSLTGQVRRDQNALVRSELSEAGAIGIIAPFNQNFGLSRNRCGTLRMVLFVVSVFSAVGLSSCLTNVWKIRYLQFLVLLVSVVALLGFIGQHIKPQKSTLWWFINVPNKNPVACFVNYNLFSGFLILLCPSSLILCTEYLAKRKVKLGLINLSCFLIMTLAVSGAMSRGALIAYFFSLIIVILLIVSSRQRAQGLIICSLGCIIIIGIGVMLGGQFEKRMRGLKHPETDYSVKERLSLWKDSIKLWRDFPLLGTGANAFRSVFPKYKSLEVPKSFNYAVNTYIQLFVEAGIFGFLLFVGLLGGYTIKVWKRFRDRIENKRLIICVVGAITAAMLHAAVDMAPYIPLYSIVLGSMAGLALGPFQNNKNVHSRRDYRVDAYPHGKLASLRPSGAKAMRMVATFSLIIVVSIFFIYKLSIDQLDKNSYITSASPQVLAGALVYAPTSWQIWYHLGRYGLFLQDKKSKQFGERCLTHATFYNPNDYRIWEALGKVRRRLQDNDGAINAYKQMMAVMPPSVRKIREHAKRKQRQADKKDIYLNP